MEISKIGERGLLEFIKKKANMKNKKIIRSIGDDAAVLTYDKKHYMLLSTDSLVENIHFKRKWFSPVQIAKKAVEQNVSDIAAMGGFPRYCLVSLQLPKDLDFLFFKKLYNGVLSQCKKNKIEIIGGNTSGASEISVSLTMIGFVEKNRLCLRSNAKKGDLICVTGDLGKSVTGLELIKRQKKGKSVDYFLNPTAKLHLARILSKNGVKAMEDISDGLVSEIYNICNASNRGAIVYKNKIPIKKETICESKKVKKDPYTLVLYGGEEFELVFCASKRIIQKLEEQKIEFSIVGRIIGKKAGIYLADGKKKVTISRGFDHFKLR